jgi:hypothetical protein
MEIHNTCTWVDYGLGLPRGTAYPVHEPSDALLKKFEAERRHVDHHPSHLDSALAREVEVELVTGRPVQASESVQLALDRRDQ